MSEQPLPPAAANAAWRWYVRLTHWLWWLVIGFWSIMLLATAALHWWIVPRILDWQPQIEAMASKAWGVQLTIGQLQSASEGWVPTFILSDVVLRNQQQQEVLRLPQVRVSLSPASLLGLTLDRIEFKAPELEVRRDAQGRWLVAGMLLAEQNNSGVLDWLLRQPHITVQEGRLRWVDELLLQPEVELSAVNIQWQNGLRSHQWRLDAKPPADWGQPFQIQGQFSQSLFNNQPSDVSTWKGRFYAQVPELDISRMSVYLQSAANIDSLTGKGWLRGWADIDRGVWNNQTLDLGLRDVQLQWDKQKDALEFESLAGRIRLQSWMDGLGYELLTEQFSVKPAKGKAWASGKTRFAWRKPRQDNEPWAATGELHLEDFPIEVLARIAVQLPLGDLTRARLAQAKPLGQVHALDMQWFDAGSASFQYKARGQIHQLQIEGSAVDPARKPESDWWPGLQNAHVEFDFNERSGKGQLDVQDGHVALVNWLDDPLVPVKSFSTALSWGKKQDRWQIRLQNAQVNNADGQGSFALNWEEGDTKLPMGRLDLQVQVQRLQAARLHRYLPTDLELSTRRYVRDALSTGWFDNATVQLQGPLDHFPFHKTNDGVFSIRAPFLQLGVQYAPPIAAAREAKAAPNNWPAVQQANGELVINRNQLQVKSNNARIGPMAAMQITQLDVQIPDLNDIVADVSAQLKGNLSDALLTTSASPLSESVGRWFNAAGVNGQADHQFRLFLPLSNLDNMRVQGSVNLLGNDIQMQAAVPKLFKAKGMIYYTQSGLNINNVRLNFLGGEARMDGALRFNENLAEGAARVNVQGSISSDAIKQAPEFSSLTALTARLNGTTNYTASLSLRQGQPELTVLSNLQGMAIDLPAPLAKPPTTSMPLRFDSNVLRAGSGRGSATQDQLQLSLGNLLSVRYWRDISGSTPSVLRGQIQLGNSTAWKEPTDNSVVLQVKQTALSMDEWQPVLNSWMDDDAVVKSSNASRSAMVSYMPTKIDLQVQELLWAGRTYNQLQVTAEKQPKQWRIQARATEFQGVADYRPAQDGTNSKVNAHLTYLSVPPAALEEVEAVMSNSPKDMPALEIVIDNLELRGIALGRADIEGFARTNTTGTREWVLNKLNLTMPEASFQSKGQWGGAAKAVAKRSQLEFTLQIQDSGDLLNRLGYKGAMRNGKGRMVGQVGWQGSPFSPDYNTMSGQFNVNMERGQFLKTEPGVARLLGVLTLQSLPRRLMLDFSDVFSEGFLFDFVRGDVAIQQGIASTNNLQMKGVSAAVLMEGRADLKNETQDLKVVIVPEINAGTASLVYSAINPLVGLTTFLAQYVLRKPLMKSNTQELLVQGTWKDPKVTKKDGSSLEGKPSTPAKPTDAKP